MIGWLNYKSYRKKADKMALNALEAYAKEYCKKNFGLVFNIPISFSIRKNPHYYGRFTSNKNHKPLKITINRTFYYIGGFDAVHKVLEHELLHYVLCEQGKPYQDIDAEFINLCIKMGVIYSGEGITCN